MFNCYFNTPITYTNPVALPVSFYYLSGRAVGMNSSLFTGNYTGQIGSVNFVPKTYNFTGGSSSQNIFSNPAGFIPKTYNFTGGSGNQNTFSGLGTTSYVPKTYNFSGNIFLSDNKTSNFGNKSSNNIFKSTQTDSSKKSTKTNEPNKPKDTSKTNNTSKPTKTTKINNSTDDYIVDTSKIPKFKSVLKTSISQECVNTANQYIGDSEANGRYKKFTQIHDCPYPGEWCADFVTYVTYEANYRQGKTPPAGFGNHDVETMKNWAIRNGYFVRTSNKPNNGSAFIPTNIKPGNIFIMNENDASHTGFVEWVDYDGTIHTIEGNRDDMVTRATYKPNTEEYKNISGFIQLG